MVPKILVAEDSVNVRKLLCVVLQGAGYEVMEAGDGQEALDNISRFTYDMLITDLNMPRLDGIGLIRKVRKSVRSRFLPIIMLTGEVQNEKQVEAMVAGASEWLAKPFKVDQLLAKVHTALA